MSASVRYAAATPGLMASLEILRASGEWEDIECAEDALIALEDGWAEAPDVLAALAISVEYQNNDIDSRAHGVRDMMVKDLNGLGAVRPEIMATVDHLKQILMEAAIREHADGHSVRLAYVHAAERLLAELEDGNAAA